MTQIESTSASADFQVVPVAGRIGAEIRGLALSSTLDTKTAAAVRAALHEHKVLFFRKQDHLNDERQEALTALFGAGPVKHPTVPVVRGTAYVHELDSRNGARANSWHTDVTFVDAYPKASILRAVSVPPHGGDTVWANTAAAYRELSPELQKVADTLWALHTNEYDYQAHGQRNAEGLKHYQEVFTSTVYETEHPLVHVHAETGEKNLLLGHFVKRILGVSSADSARLFQLFQDHVTRLENTVRWRWEAGDVAIWDNRATQHYAIDDYGDQLRIVRRVTVDGEPPVAVDGRRSKTRKVSPKAEAAKQPAAAQSATA